MKRLNTKSSPGDLFHIPAVNKDGKVGFVIARYIELLTPNVGYIIEVFAKFYTSLPSTLTEVDISRRLFRPIMIDMSFRYVPRWRVLFSDAAYDKSQSGYEQIAFAFYSEAWIGGVEFKMSREELAKFEESICWRTHHVIFRVNAHLEGIFNPDERYDHQRVPESKRFDNPAAFDDVVRVANLVEDNFKLWEKKKEQSRAGKL